MQDIAGEMTCDKEGELAGEMMCHKASTGGGGTTGDVKKCDIAEG